MDKLETTRVAPRYEPKRYEIEVYVAFNGTHPFVNAGVVGAQYQPTPPTGDIVKRYVFDVEVPTRTAPKEQTNDN